jgi:hypothetical protein
LLPASGRLRHGELLGEASPYYLANPVAPAQLRFLAPRAKLIMMLRAPPDHCWSASTAAVQAAWLRDGTSAPCRLMERSATRLLAHYHPCDPSHYTDALERWMHHVPAEQMLVLLFERFADQPERELQAIRRFLGLSAFEFARSSNVSAHARNRHATSSMPPDTRRWLEGCHADETRQLARLLDAPRLRGAPGAALRAQPAWQRLLRHAAAGTAHANNASVPHAHAASFSHDSGEHSSHTVAESPSRADAPDALIAPRPRVGVVMHTYGRRPTPGMSAVADNVCAHGPTLPILTLSLDLEPWLD